VVTVTENAVISVSESAVFSLTIPLKEQNIISESGGI
jgi:hypothetical protein